MNFQEYIAPLKRWWWLLVVATLVAAFSSFIATLGQAPLYQSRTTLIIGQSINNPNPSSNQFYLEEQLASIYADMATREPVRKAVMETLQLQWLPEYTVRALPDTQLIEIAVTDTNPLRAQAVASELANQLIKRSPTSAQPEDQDRQAFINEQLSLLEADITATQEELQRLNTALGGLSSAQQINETEREIATLENKLTTLQSNYASLLSSTQKGALNTLSVIEPAEVPGRPISANKVITIATAAMFGLFLSVAGAYLIEFLDQSVKNTDDAKRALNLPLLIEIPRFPKDANTLNYILKEPFSAIADSFRSLRANLELSGLGSTYKTLVITSAGVADGKSTLALNLMYTFAKAKKRVVLVDADFHKSELEKRLGFERRRGLGELLRDGTSAREALVPLKKGSMYFLPKGTAPGNPGELIGSAEMNRILREVSADADVVIIDSPPFIVSEALVLASKADGVLIVTSLNRSRRDVLARMREQFERNKVRMVGFVVNGIEPRSSYYEMYYHQDDTQEKDDQPKPLKRGLFKKRPAGAAESEPEKPGPEITGI
jgi:capsular exopolysaccharide synthesis family protein